MNFVHIADIHFDAPFINLSDKEGFGELKRLEQRKIFKQVIEYIKKENIENLFISGDLYESQYIQESTIKYINNLFKEIPNTKIYIAPGNHDPFTKDSYYNTFNWNENVHIFNNNIEKIEYNNVDIYGYGFNDYYCSDSKINEMNIENKNKVNVLIVHGTLDGSITSEKQYNPISSKELREKEFDYVALGHIHKSNYSSDNHTIIYPGSLVGLGFDELGEHGIITGEIKDGKVVTQFIPIEQKEFKEEQIDVTNIISNEELIETINNLKINDNIFLKINLIGKRNFEINISNMYKLISNKNIIKIKNNTEINYDLEKMANESTLTGLFIKEMLKKLNNENINLEEKEIIEKSIEIGLEALK